MARAALGWGVRELARSAKVSTDTISRLERGGELKERTLDDICGVLEAAGVEFLPDNGVRLKPAQVAPVPGRADPGTTRKPEPEKPAPRARRAPQPKAAPTSKLEQIRALREQGAR
jgi:transcriptional regulator with XRE-family HTH domain